MGGYKEVSELYTEAKREFEAGKKERLLLEKNDPKVLQSYKIR